MPPTAFRLSANSAACSWFPCDCNSELQQSDALQILDHNMQKKVFNFCCSLRGRHSFVPEEGSGEAGSSNTQRCACVFIGLLVWEIAVNQNIGGRTFPHMAFLLPWKSDVSPFTYR